MNAFIDSVDIIEGAIVEVGIRIGVWVRDSVRAGDGGDGGAGGC